MTLWGPFDRGELTMTPSCQHALVIPGTDVCPICDLRKGVDALQVVVLKKTRELDETIALNTATNAQLAAAKAEYAECKAVKKALAERSNHYERESLERGKELKQTQKVLQNAYNWGVHSFGVYKTAAGIPAWLEEAHDCLLGEEE